MQFNDFSPELQSRIVQSMISARAAAQQQFFQTKLIGATRPYCKNKSMLESSRARVARHHVSAPTRRTTGPTMSLVSVEMRRFQMVFNDRTHHSAADPNALQQEAAMLLEIARGSRPV